MEYTSMNPNEKRYRNSDLLMLFLPKSCNAYCRSSVNQS